MGGDGGTVAANRAYLRGAGKADHTADRASSSSSSNRLGGGIEDDANRARATLSTCAVSGATLRHGIDDVVVCPHGKLYRREDALESLLRRSSHSREGGRKEGGGEGGTMMGLHVRGMKDLHPVRFHLTATTGGGKMTPTCPISGSDIGKGNVPSLVVVRSHGGDDRRDDRGPNVLSERAIREMGIRGLQEEYGPFEERDMIRLAPPITGGTFERIRKRWEQRMEEERIAKSQKKDKKRKRGRGGDVDDAKARPSSGEVVDSTARSDAARDGGGDMRRDNEDKRTTTTTSKKKKSAADEARSTVMTAMAHNPVLSDLFGGGKEEGRNNRTEKEKRDALFTRNC
ncbi:hypothetical protein ACHAW5_005105 [Stephanodiscus triporus]|uniref:Replication termination factor 2 n=1 Tax=Stephanodiscus triporus TaxID=2934178 RepID=A0ABD3MME4_9STRA